jgi:hypothetical protein
MPRVRTSRLFGKLPDLDLSGFAGGVIVGFTANPDLADPPETPAELQTKKTAFDAAIVAAASGGKLKTALKDAARAVLIDALNKDASYVDINCNEDLAILLSSGFQPVSTNHAQQVLEAPVIISAINGPQAGKIRLRVTGDPLRKGIQGRVKAMGGEFGPAITFKSAKEIIFTGLTAGTTYVMQLIGIGGSTGQSDWSEPVTKVAT